EEKDVASSEARRGRSDACGSDERQKGARRDDCGGIGDASHGDAKVAKTAGRSGHVARHEEGIRATGSKRKRQRSQRASAKAGRGDYDGFERRGSISQPPEEDDRDLRIAVSVDLLNGNPHVVVGKRAVGRQEALTAVLNRSWATSQPAVGNIGQAFAALDV